MLRTTSNNRMGAVAPLFALVLPILFLLSGFAINIAYMQLVSSEMKIATDSAAHAGGRAMSIAQTTDAALNLAKQVAAENLVGGRSLELTITDSDDDMTFGLSTRQGTGRYNFTGYTQADVDAGNERATSFAVEGFADVPFIFMTIPGISDTVGVRRRSIATQVDRDIALVLDRSGSMLYYENETALTAALLQLYEGVEVEVPATEGYWEYHWWQWSNRRNRWRDRGYWSEDDANSSWVRRDPDDKQWVDGEEAHVEVQSVISESEYDDATRFLYDRRYSQNVIDQLAIHFDVEMSEYTDDWQRMINSSFNWSSRAPAPNHSRWSNLRDGVDAFLTVLEGTDQEELVALSLFNNNATLALELQSNYNSIRNTIAGIVPYEGTAIGDGMTVGHPEIIDGARARPFAAKTIVVLTDGENNNGVDPVVAAGNIVDADAVTIHTVTFATDNQDAKDAMHDVAVEGHGKHYHADTGAELVATFEEIANNLPTILTE